MNTDNPPAPGKAKHSFTSNINSVLLLARTLIEPLVPANTIAALTVAVPVVELKFAVPGCVGQAVTNTNGLCGTTAKFNEYAWAFPGKLQRPVGSGNGLALGEGSAYYLAARKPSVIPWNYSIRFFAARCEARGCPLFFRSRVPYQSGSCSSFCRLLVPPSPGISGPPLRGSSDYPLCHAHP